MKMLCRGSCQLRPRAPSHAALIMLRPTKTSVHQGSLTALGNSTALLSQFDCAKFAHLMSIPYRCRSLSEPSIIATAKRIALITGYVSRAVVLAVFTDGICSCTEGGIGEELARQYHARGSCLTSVSPWCNEVMNPIKTPSLRNCS